ncbi:hypothetical protein GCM10022251_16730 [Phytohabitans flavus]
MSRTAASGQPPHESYCYTKPDHLPSRVPQRYPPGPLIGNAYFATRAWPLPAAVGSLVTAAWTRNRSKGRLLLYDLGEGSELGPGFGRAAEARGRLKVHVTAGGRLRSEL